VLNVKIGKTVGAKAYWISTSCFKAEASNRKLGH